MENSHPRLDWKFPTRDTTLVTDVIFQETTGWDLVSLGRAILDFKKNSPLVNPVSRENLGSFLSTENVPAPFWGGVSQFSSHFGQICFLGPDTGFPKHPIRFWDRIPDIIRIRYPVPKPDRMFWKTGIRSQCFFDQNGSKSGLPPLRMELAHFRSTKTNPNFL